MAKKLVGNDPDQVPTNGDLGTLAFQDGDNASIGPISVVDGDVTVSGDLSLGDNDFLNVGFGNDLRFYHDGTHSYIQETGTGALKILGTNINIENEDGSKRYIDCNDGGSVELWYNNSKKFETTNTGISVSGDATISGSLSKGSGSFKINHPLKPQSHHLVHSFVESPQADNIYRGKVNLINGTATVNIDTVAGMTDGTFVALNREIQCFTSNESGWTAVRGSVSGNILTIESQDNTATDTISWMVVGERQDQHMYDAKWTDENGKVIVELEKPPVEEPEST